MNHADEVIDLHISKVLGVGGWTVSTATTKDGVLCDNYQNASLEKTLGETGFTVTYQEDGCDTTVGAFTPTDIAGLEGWYKFNTGITETGQGVSQWDDQSGNDRHLLQGTDGNRPPKQVDGSILFNGTDESLKATAFTLNQPETIYLLFKQISWTSGDTIVDGNTTTSGRCAQSGTTPQLALTAGTLLLGGSELVLDTYGAVCWVINGLTSVIQINNETPVEGAAGAANMGGLTLGATGGSTAQANIQVKELIVYSTAHDQTTRDQVIAYLNAL